VESKSRKEKPRKQKPLPKRPSELERLEAAIAENERLVADLEHKLAKDYSDADTLAAHRRARDDLQALLAKWETLFERTQAPT
jgi:hypothetical protein